MPAVLDGARPTPVWMDRWRVRVAELRLAAGDALRGLLDDFVSSLVILCGSESQATDALQTVRAILSERRLQLNLDKTRVVPPSKAFEFLGYRFEPDGRIVPPETPPDIVRRRVVDFARHQILKRRNSRS